jgi:hypothetical protein
VRRMPSSGMLRRMALVRTYVAEECTASIIRVTGMGELGTTLAVLLRCVLRSLVTANLVTNSPFLLTLIMDAILSS